MRRVILVLTDGLRPDAITPTVMPSLHALGDAYARRLVDEAAEDKLLFVYLPDCDWAGHTHGWLSPAYLDAAAEVDAGIGILSGCVEDTLVVVVADHGGGGVKATEHYYPHPQNDHVPLVLAGPGVARRHALTGPISIPDVSPTLLWWFGTPVPACYEGRPPLEAFAPPLGAEVAAR